MSVEYQDQVEVARVMFEQHISYDEAVRVQAASERVRREVERKVQS